jgi:23S rRNA A2030 N6-methylase RlmJ
MAYDHHRKAGNQGDCVKHPPLTAALDQVLRNPSNSQRLCHFLDVFAGHAWHPLLDGDEYEWKYGIGKLASATLPSDAPESVKCWWGMWHDAPEWPTTAPPGYPGSSWIAAHRCHKAQRPVKLELYDRAEEVRRDLERAFPTSHAIQDAIPNICLIGQSLDPTQAKQDHIQQADFVFIDPPGWQSDKHPEYPKSQETLEHLLKPRGKDGKPTLMWMPTAGNDGVFGGKPSEKMKLCGDCGYKWSAVRWQTAGPEACVLVYNCAPDAIKSAIDSIVRVAEWGKGKNQFQAVEHSRSASCSMA